MFSNDMYVSTADPISDEMPYGVHPFAPAAGDGATMTEALAWEALIYDRDPIGGSVSPY